MKKPLFIGITATLILASLTAGCLGGDDDDKEEPLPNLGSAPNFTLVSIDNDTFSLSDFEGKVVILDFMDTHCTPCEDEMEHLDDVFDNYDDSQVQIISIDVDETETNEMLSDFKDTYGDDWLFAIDTDGDVEDDYSISAIPVIVLIDQNGDIRFKHVGSDEETSYEALAKMIDKLL